MKEHFQNCFASFELMVEKGQKGRTESHTSETT